MRGRHSRTPLSPLRVLLVLILAATTSAVVSLATPAAGAGDCEVDPTTGKGFGVGCPGLPPNNNGNNGSNGNNGNGNNGDPSGPPPCDWKVAPLGNGMEDYLRSMFPDAPPDAVFQYNDCSTIGPGLVYTQYRWVPPSEATPPSPQQVAAEFWVDVKATLDEPDVATDPPAGEPALIHTATFVEVTNWQDGFSRSRCLLGVCVTITATPTLEFDPAEPEAGAIACDPPGTRFDPNGPEPDEQAAVEGACAHVYQHRSGSGTDPARWPDVVTITWRATWTSNVGARGVFDPLRLSTAVPRAVDEMQTVNNEVGAGDGG